MLVFSAFIPPTPLLIPSIGKEHTGQLKATADAVRLLQKRLTVSYPDVCIIISQHAMLPERFGIGISDRYHGSLQSFGDLTEYKVKGLPSLAQFMIAHAPYGIASAVTNLSLDHGNAVPLRLLFPENPLPFIPLYPSNASPEAHLRFGASLSESLHAHPSRIALIAAGDLSHHVSDASPEGRREEGMLFDKAMLHALKKHSIKQLLDIAYKFEEETSASGMRTLLILLGILDDFHARFNLLSYEAPFGIGYAVAEYAL